MRAISLTLIDLAAAIQATLPDGWAQVGNAAELADTPANQWSKRWFLAPRGFTRTARKGEGAAGLMDSTHDLSVVLLHRLAPGDRLAQVYALADVAEDLAAWLEAPGNWTAGVDQLDFLEVVQTVGQGLKTSLRAECEVRFTLTKRQQL